MKVRKGRSKSKKLLLMGSSAFKAKELPAEMRNRIDEAIAGKLKIIVGEAQGHAGFTKFTETWWSATR